MHFPDTTNNAKSSHLASRRALVLLAFACARSTASFLVFVFSSGYVKPGDTRKKRGNALPWL